MTAYPCILFYCHLRKTPRPNCSKLMTFLVIKTLDFQRNCTLKYCHFMSINSPLFSKAIGALDCTFACAVEDLMDS